VFQIRGNAQECGDASPGESADASRAVQRWGIRRWQAPSAAAALNLEQTGGHGGERRALNA